jgi:hypothetical protein
MATNLEIQLQLNRALQDALAIMDSQTKTMQAQSGMLQTMVKLQEAANKASGKAAISSKDVADALEEAEKASAKLGDVNLDQLNSGLEKSEQTTQTFNETMTIAAKKTALFSVASQGLKGFAQGFSFLGNGLKTVGSLLLTTMNVVGQFAASIISFPFKLLSGLISEADNLSGDTSLAQELENIRKEFGYLNKSAGGAVTSLAKSMSGELANTGLSVFRVFGRLHERLAFFREYFTALGPIADNVITKIGEGGAEALGAYNKALGFTAEGQKALATRALATGQTVNELNRQVANYALQLSDRFGVTMKAVSRQMGEMMADFENFGHMAPRELAQVAVYARKLGIEVKSLAGVMNKSFNFEDAANQSAQLSQAFGITVDALQQVTEQDPAKKMDNLRKAFFAAGRSVETMTIQERRLLAQQTGLDASALDLAFSLKNQGLSYADVQKKGDAAKKSQLTQTQALQKLAGAIERQVQAMQKLGGGGFFDRFIQGINAGIRRSSDFRKMIWDIRKDLNATFREGMRVGRDLVKMFPGIKEMFDGIKGMFNPAVFRQMLHSVRDTFKKFFKDMTDNPREALGKLMENLKKNFFDWFNSRNSSGRQLLSGIQNFFKAFATIVNSGLRIGLDGLTKGIRLVVDLITGRQTLAGLMSGAGDAGSAALGFLRPIFDRLVDGLGPAFSGLWDALQKLGTVLWAKFQERTVPWLKSNIGMLFALVFGPPVVASISRMVGTAFIRGIAQGLAGAVASSAMERLFKSAGSRAAARAPDLSGAEAASNTARDSRISAGVLPKLAMIAGVIAIGMVAIFAAIKLVKSQNLSLGDIALGAAMLTGSVPALAAAVLIARTASTMDASAAARAAPALGAVGIVVGVGLVAMLLAVGAVSAMNITFEDITKGVMLLNGAVPILLASALVVGAASLLNPGAAATAVPGLLAVGAVMWATGAFATIVIGVAKGFSLADFAKATAMMTVMGGLLTMAALAAVAAMGIGALLVGSMGLGVGALAAGLAALGVIVAAMSTATIKIMHDVSALTLPAGYEAKIAAFVSVTRAIGEFTRIFGDILAATRPSLVSLLRGNSKEILETQLTGIKGIIETIGSQVTSLITLFSNLSSTITPEQINNGRFIIEVVTAISGFARGMTGPVEMLRDTSRWWENSDVPGKIQTMANFVGTMSISLIHVMTAIGSLLTGSTFQGVKPSDLAARAQVISTMLTAIADFATKLQPSPRVVLALSDTAAGQARNDLVTSLSDYIRGMVNALIRSDLFSTVRTLIDNILQDVAALSADNIAKIQTVAPVIGAAFRMIGTLMQVFQNITVPSGSAADVTGLITSFENFSRAFTNQASGTIAAVLTSITLLAQRITPQMVANLQGVFPTLQAVFQFIGTVPGLITSLGTAGTTTGGAGANVTAVTNSMTTLREFVDSLFGASSGNGLLKSVLDKLNSPNLVIPKGAAAKLQQVGTLFTTIRTTVDAFIPLGTIASGSLTEAGRGMGEFFTALLGGGDGQVGALSDALATAIMLPTIPRGTAAKFQQVGTLFTTLKATAVALEGLGTITPGTIATVGSLSSFLGAMIGSGDSSLDSSVRALNRMPAVTTNTIDKLQQVVDLFKGLKTVSESFTGFGGAENNMTVAATGIGSMRSGLQRVLAEAGQDGSILGETMGTIGSRIARIVQEVNSVNAEIARLQPININATLQTLTNNIGLGQTAEFRINRGSLNLNLNATIKIVAQDLEEILINRVDSRIAVTKG